MSSENKKLIQAIKLVEQEKGVRAEALFEAIENALLKAVKAEYGKKNEDGQPEKVKNGEGYNNMSVDMNRETGEYHVYLEKEVVEEVTDPVVTISLPDARLVDTTAEIGDTVKVEVDSKQFSRTVISNAKGVIIQTIREEEKQNILNHYKDKQDKIITGVVSRIKDNRIIVDIGKTEAVLEENEQVPTEHYQIGDRIKLYVISVKDRSKQDEKKDKDGKKKKSRYNKLNIKVAVSRTHKNLIKELFALEVSEINDGIVKIESISRDPGSRAKIAVSSTDEDVDPIGACVGVNGERVNAVVEELGGEKIDIIKYEENAALYVENALSPAQAQYVAVDTDDKQALVVVPDDQLSLAIGKSGQNAKLAAKLTGYKIDIKSESQAREEGIEFMAESYDDDEYDEYDDEYEYEDYEDGDDYEENDYSKEDGYEEDEVNSDFEEESDESEK